MREAETRHWSLRSAESVPGETEEKEEEKEKLRGYGWTARQGLRVTLRVWRIRRKPGPDRKSPRKLGALALREKLHPADATRWEAFEGRAGAISGNVMLSPLKMTRPSQDE